MAQIDQIVNDHLVAKLSPDSTVIDVGAHTGWLSKQLCQEMSADPANFYLLEACPDNYRIAKQECPGFNVLNLAASDRDGETMIFVGDDQTEASGTSQSNSLFKEFIDNKDWNPQTREVPVKAVTLNTFFAENDLQQVDYLKINCEGGEYKILSADASLDYLENVRFIYLQMHGKDPVFLTPEMLESKLRINRMLMERGFRIILGDHTETIPSIRKHIKQLWVNEKFAAE